MWGPLPKDSLSGNLILNAHQPYRLVTATERLVA
ncbi:hypothetical protein NONO_c56590 [Nocardia nova SH22a]|uniref:Uncharacterized protein n=1 Tax=Nocardia nova SH22a TaxID=1415166 RepID=W5TMV4_9NOCA|nr:hypothetical protein NONO_c56590 [Nocardia nova SH22a]